jgi:signal transduction histidine kinase
MVTLPVIADEWFTFPLNSAPSPGLRTPAAQAALLALQLAFCIGFGAAFWWNTRNIGAGKLTRAGAGLLVFQISLSTFSPELMFIVACELPLMMTVRKALRWLAVQCGILVALIAVALAAGDFVPTDTLLHAPLAVSVPGTFFYMLAWTFLSFGVGHFAANEARARGDLARANSELMATRALLSDATRVGERLRISRELHDAVGHHLAGLSINLQLASRLVQGPAAEPVREAHLVAKMLLAEVREVVGTLRDPRQTDLRRALGLLADGVAQPCVHMDLADGLDRIDAQSAHVFFRCAQEAITNAIKHSGAGNLWVELQETGAGWDMLVRDDGCGAARIVTGNGLQGMAERLAEVGGRLKLESRAGGGFTLRACIPVQGTPS